MPDANLKVAGNREVELLVDGRLERAFHRFYHEGTLPSQRPEMMETCSKIKKILWGTGYLHISGR